MKGVAVYLHDTITGDLKGDITHHLAGGTGTDLLNSFGDATLQLKGADVVTPTTIFRASAVWEALRTNEITFTIVRLAAFGQVLSVVGSYVLLRKKWSDATEQIEIYGEQLRTLMQHRWTFDVLNFALGDFTFTDVSRRTAARLIMERATWFGPTWQLPITYYGASHAPGSFSIDVLRYDMTTIEDLLVQLEKFGTEIRYEAYLTSNHDLRYAVYADRELVSDEPATRIPYGAAKTPIVNYEVEEDGTGQISSAFATGKGMGSQIPFERADFMLDGPRMPSRMGGVSAPDVTDAVVLKQMADAQMQLNRSPQTAAQLQISTDTSWPLELFQTRRVIVIDRRKHRVLPDELLSYRVVGLQFDVNSDVVTPTLERLRS